MMDGEEVYRTRSAACRAAADASPRPRVRERHLTAAPCWQALLDATMERKAGVIALQHVVASIASVEATDMSDTEFQIPDPVIDAIEGGTPAVRAFRQSSGLSQHDAAVAAHVDDERLAAIESGRKTATAAETEELSEALHVPADLLIDE